MNIGNSWNILQISKKGYQVHFFKILISEWSCSRRLVRLASAGSDWTRRVILPLNSSISIRCYIMTHFALSLALAHSNRFDFLRFVVSYSTFHQLSACHHKSKVLWNYLIDIFDKLILEEDHDFSNLQLWGFLHGIISIRTFWSSIL